MEEEDVMDGSGWRVGAELMNEPKQRDAKRKTRKGWGTYNARTTSYTRRPDCGSRAEAGRLFDQP